MVDLDLTVLDSLEQTLLVHRRGHLLAGVESIQPLERAGVLVERPIPVEDVDDIDLVLVPLPDLVVVGVVRRSDLHATAAEFGLGPLVADDRKFAFLQG